MALKKKLLMITGSFPPMPCGVGDYCAQLVSALATQGDWRITVLTDHGAAEVMPPVGVTVLPCVVGWGWRGVVRLLRLVRELQPDLIHIQYPTQGYAGAWGIQFLPLMLQWTGFKVVQTWHEAYQLRLLPNAFAINQCIIVVEPDYLMRVQPYYRPLIARRLRYIPVAASIPRVILSEVERLRQRGDFVKPDERLLVYFGFAVPSKCIELIFEIADPQRDIIILVCELDTHNPYQHELLELAAGTSWSGRVVVTGFLPVGEVARLLSIADAAIFPFSEGVGMRNTSVLAARTQGTFTLTTSQHRVGYDIKEHVFYAPPADCATMRNALNQYAGCHQESTLDVEQSWSAIAEAHLAVYQAEL